VQPLPAEEPAKELTALFEENKDNVEESPKENVEVVPPLSTTGKKRRHLLIELQRLFGWLELVDHAAISTGMKPLL
jgi:hypothetical protein